MMAVGPGSQDITEGTRVRLSLRDYALLLGTLLGMVAVPVSAGTAAYVRMDMRVNALEHSQMQELREKQEMIKRNSEELREMRTSIASLTRTVDRWIGERRRLEAERHE